MKLPTDPVGKLFYLRFPHESDSEFLLRTKSIKYRDEDRESISEDQLAMIEHRFREPSIFQHRSFYSICAIAGVFLFSYITAYLINTTDNPVSQLNVRHLEGVPRASGDLYVEREKYSDKLIGLERRLAATRQRVNDLDMLIAQQELTGDTLYASYEQDHELKFNYRHVKAREVKEPLTWTESLRLKYFNF